MIAHTFILKVAKGLVLTHGLFCFIICQAQTNPWITEQSGNNPWGDYIGNTQSKQTNSPEANVQINADSAAKELSKLLAADSMLNSFQEAEIATFLVRNSKDSVVYFNVNDTILRLNTKGRKFFRTLRKQGKKSHEARLALGIGIGSATLISVFALPFNLIGSAIPTPKTRAIINKFKTDNPHATKKEVNAFKLGVSASRFDNACTGVAVGIGANIALIIGVGTFALSSSS